MVSRRAASAQDPYLKRRGHPRRFSVRRKEYINISVGADDSVRPPMLYRTSCKRCHCETSSQTGRGERAERCQWQTKRGERVAAVKILSVRRKAAQKFWAPQQGHPPPVPSAPWPNGGWHGKAVTGGFHTSPHLLQPFRRGGVLPRPREGQSPSPTHHKIRFRRGRPPGRPARPLTAAHATFS